MPWRTNKINMKKLAFLLIAPFLLSACLHIPADRGTTKDTETESMMMKEGPSEDSMMKKVDDDMMVAMKDKTYQYSGALTDVTKGEVTGINTWGEASGTAQASFENGVYSLLATFDSLPTPQGSDFYEGWVVRKQPFHFISTGRVDLSNGTYTNTYTSGENFTDHDFYVLTIEPDDGDPAPAEHIVEGTMLPTSP